MMAFRGSMIALALSAALMFVSTARAEDKAATSQPSGGATGTWKWEQPGFNGSQQVTLTLKQDGDKLTGTISGPGGDTEISDGSFKDGKVSFKVSREFGGNPITTTYTGTVSGDSFKGSAETVIKRDFDAKRGQ